MSVLVRRFGFLIVIAIIGVGGFLFRDRLSGNAGDLQVGDCFDVPTGETRTVKDVQHHPCTEAHTGEVFAIVKYPGDPAYPDEQARLAFVGQQCPAPFLAYVGAPLETSVLDVGFFSPTSGGWSDGDRTFTCYVESIPATTISSKGSKH